MLPVNRMCRHSNRSRIPFTLEEDVPFDIDRNSGVIEVNGPIDYESVREYTFTVKVRDVDGGIGALSALTTVFVEVTNLNEHTPVFGPNTYTVTLSENTTVLTSVLNLTATDQDYGVDGELQYSLDNDMDPFYADPVSGEVFLTSPLDFETMTSYTFEAYVNDMGVGGLSDTAQITIVVTDFNDIGPACPPVYYVSLSEDEGVGGHVQSISCTDTPDSNTPLIQYTLDPGTSPLFTIDSSGAVTLTGSLDYETEKRYTIHIIATSAGPSQLTGLSSIDLTLTPINEYPPTFPPGGYTINVPENAPIATSVGSLVATDNDDSFTDHGRVRYKVTGGIGNDTFKFEGNALFLMKPLDREETPSYSIDIELADSQPGDASMLSSSTTLTIIVTDINDNHPEFEAVADILEVSETRPQGSVIYTLDIDDEDSGNNGVYDLTIVDGNQLGFFERSGNIITLARQLDYETPLRKFSLKLRARDRGSSTLERVMALDVLVMAENEHSPVIVRTTPEISLRENQVVATVIHTVSAKDKDDGRDGDMLYSLLSHQDSFFIDPVNGELYLIKPFSFDGAQIQLSLALEVVDLAPLPNRLNDTWNLSVVVYGYSAPRFHQDLYLQYVKEDATPQDVVLQLDATDEDEEALRYSIVGGDGRSTFEIGTNTGVIRLKAMSTLDYETRILYSLVVRVEDSGTQGTVLRSETKVRLVVTDVVDTEPVFDSITGASVLENLPIGTYITTVNARISEMNHIVAYSLNVRGESGDTSFRIDASSGKIFTKKILDREERDR